MLRSAATVARLAGAWDDPLRLVGELAARQVYWRVPALVKWYHRRRGEQQAAQVADPLRLREHLRDAGVGPGALVMVHSSVQGVSLASEGDPGPALSNPLMVSLRLIGMLGELLGEAGTLVMPTHPLYPNDPGFMAPGKSRLECVYDPRATPSSVGLMTECFRRKPGVRRSLHPLSSVAARGPLATALLEDNLREDRPLPHGRGSSYHRFATRGGLVVSLGLPLIRCITMVHVAEELRDETWPCRDFFRERPFRVRADGEEARWVVRERRPEYVRTLGLAKLRRDLLAEGILHEGVVGTLRVDRADAGQVLEYMSRRNAGTTYPYYLPWTAGPFA